MAKRVLVVYYSQTGQLAKVMERIVSPLAEEEGIELHVAPLHSTETFAFPWSFFRFFDLFPEAVYLDPPANNPLEIPDPSAFDLILLGYQPWFLSPSLPMSAFLQSEQARIILAGKPVITIIGCRNMWIEGQKTMRELIVSCKGRLIDNVVLRDQSGPLESFITTPRWMLTGKKEPFCGLSAAGIDHEMIQNSRRFGEAIVAGLKKDTERQNEPMLQGLGAVCVDPRFIASEKIGKRSFRIWGRLVRMFGDRGSWRRRPILILYVTFLIALIVSVVPINMAIQTIIRRLFKGKMDKIIKTIEAPSGR